MVTTEEVVHSHPEIMSGMPVFVGTRVPVKALFDYVRPKEGIEEFLDDFPTVSRAQALAALDLAENLVVAHAYTTRRVCPAEA